MKKRNNIQFLAKLGLIASSYAFALDLCAQNTANFWALESTPSKPTEESPLFPEHGDLHFDLQRQPEKTSTPTPPNSSPLPGQSTLFFSLETPAPMSPAEEEFSQPQRPQKNRRNPVALQEESSFFNLTSQPEFAQASESLKSTTPAPSPSDVPQVKTPPTPAIKEPELNNTDALRLQINPTATPSQAVTPVQPTQKIAPLPPRTPVQEKAVQAPVTAKASTPVPTLINFNNISIIEYIRFISRITGKNFVFNENDLQFNITIISEEPTSLENIMTALLQEIRIHDLEMMEQGNSIIIHRNPRVNAISKVVSDDPSDETVKNAEIVTQVFRLNTLEPIKAATIIRPLMSENALLETLTEPNQLIITDLVSNVGQINKLLKSLDSPNGGLVIGQYVVHTSEINTLLPLAQQIMQPISQDQPLILVPYENTNSIFIVSSPFLVERTISILQHLDQERAKTRIIDLNQLKFHGPTGATGAQNGGKGTTGATGATGQGSQATSGSGATAQGWQYGPGTSITPSDGSDLGIFPIFIPVDEGGRGGGYRGHDTQSLGYTEFNTAEPIQPIKITRKGEPVESYIPVPSDRMKFYLHKLQYRKGDAVMEQVQQIATSLQESPGHINLSAIINTMQWLQDSKTLVFTGTPEDIEKLKSLVEQIDIPLRQVYIEMLILQTTMDETLEFGVNWGQRFGGGHQAGSQGFQAGVSQLQGSLDTAGVTGLGGSLPNVNTGTPFNNAIIPNPNNLAKNDGFSLGILGQHIIHKGLGIEFNSIGALIRAIHDRDQDKIIQTPRIMTEDGVPAQIFVGINTPFKTQSVSNDQGSIVTNNFEFRDIGTSLQVTPYLHNSDIVTLEVVQEVSSVAGQTTTNGNSNQIVGPTTNKNSTKTTIHIPNGYFVIMSGMMQDDVRTTRNQVPCLGGLPMIGAGFSHKLDIDQKRNLMIFIRPVIVDTDEQFQNITRHQQDLYKVYSTPKKSWIYETEEGLDFLNLRRTYNTDDVDDEPEYHFAH